MWGETLSTLFLEILTSTDQLSGKQLWGNDCFCIPTISGILLFPQPRHSEKAGVCLLIPLTPALQGKAARCKQGAARQSRQRPPPGCAPAP